MPYLTIAAPAFSFEQKKIMAAELTEVLLKTLALPDNERERVVIRFLPYQTDEMAVGGRLVCETEEPLYRVEVRAHQLDARRREKLANALMPCVHELLGLGEGREKRIHIVFHSDSPGEIVTNRQASVHSPIGL